MEEQRLATRVSSACDRCRQQKQRCTVTRPCINCTKARCECISTDLPTARKERPAKRRRVPSYPPSSSIEDQNSGTEATLRREASLRRSEPSIVTEFVNSDSAFDVTRRVLQYRSPESRATFALPGGDLGAMPRSAESFYSVADILGVGLPAHDTVEKLLDIYFYTVHWFSLVVHEPSFRRRYETIMTTGQARTSDRPFLLLLLMILIMSCQYAPSISDPKLEQFDLSGLRIRYMRTLRSNFMDLLEEDSIEVIQLCTLLGSYWLYWGKPRSSFTVLGAAIKAAQANSLHRQANSRDMYTSQPTVEERKRVWWTIYTWDRFATIVYGRPLSIVDRDCDVPMPGIFPECVKDIYSSDVVDIELSRYQIDLNRVYRIAAPMLENIFGVHKQARSSFNDMAKTVKNIDESMKQWQSSLIFELDLDQNRDISTHTPLRQKIHHLQALSLRLTYLNLKIVIHRPLITNRRLRDPDRSSTPQYSAVPENTFRDTCNASLEECLQAALAISRLGQTKPNLILLAGKTHLVSFLAMNIFTSSVVLFICAMSDILSNSAQEAKRGISRNLKILKSMADSGSLSSQCNVIVGELVHLILEKEKEEMLLGPLNIEESVDNMIESRQLPYDHLIAVPLESRRHSEVVPSFETFQQAQEELDFDNSTLAFERTMDQLQKVLKDASQTRGLDTRRDMHYDRSGTTEDHIPAGSLWQDNQTIRNDQDMTQFWLWNLESQEGTMLDWAGFNF